MIYIFFLIVLFIGALIAAFLDLRGFTAFLKVKEDELLSKYVSIKSQNDAMAVEVSSLENKVSEYFFFYELTRNIAPLLNKKDLFEVFFDEMKTFGDIKQLSGPCIEGADGCLAIRAGDELGDTVYLQTKSTKIIEYLPHFSSLLKLCGERVELYEKLQQLSIYDSLTEVYNRRYFMMRFGEEFSRAQKHGLNLSFLMIDIDNFKKINDTYGHLVGDAILREVARIIQSNLREIDFVTRYGGEEFGVVLLETEKVGAILVAERICSRISQERIRVFDEILSVTVSVGVATYPGNTRYSDVLIETADKALYKAKISGKNRVCYF